MITCSAGNCCAPGSIHRLIRCESTSTYIPQACFTSASMADPAVKRYSTLSNNFAWAPHLPQYVLAHASGTQNNFLAKHATGLSIEYVVSVLCHRASRTEGYSRQFRDVNSLLPSGCLRAVAIDPPVSDGIKYMCSTSKNVCESFPDRGIA